MARDSDQRGCDRVVRPKRKPIPTIIRIMVLSRQDGRCLGCGDQFTSELAEMDHRPSLIMRPVNAAGTDYEPPQLDPDYLEALCEECHQKRTTGRKPGAERTPTTKGSDVWLAKKFRRLEGEPRKKAKFPKQKNKWPKQKFNSRP